MGPSVRYNLISMITVLCVLTVSICMSCLHAVAFVKDIHMHIYAVTDLLMLTFWIKLIMKMPKYLTEKLTNVCKVAMKLLLSSPGSGLLEI